MDDDIGICDQCKRPLMMIDRYGEEFVGCVACNRWGSSSTDLFMRLSEDDLRADAHYMTQVNTGPSEPCKAHHEAGHAVIADSLGYKVHLVTIVADGPTNTQGRTEYDDPLERQHERRVEHALTICFAGPAAQDKFASHSLRADDARRDYVKVLDIVSRFRVDDETRWACRLKARELVEEHWEEIEALALRLLDKGTLTFTS